MPKNNGNLRINNGKVEAQENIKYSYKKIECIGWYALVCDWLLWFDNTIHHSPLCHFPTFIYFFPSSGCGLEHYINRTRIFSEKIKRDVKERF